ncbi:MAG: acetyl-CoA carboxylase, carboxyltransferase subunit beta [Alphaproteobacteria bacterium]
MSWLTDFVRPKIQALVGRPDQPDNLWHKCPACEQMIFHRELQEADHVCPHCSHHMRLGVKRRLELLFDDGEYQRIELPKVETDPLRFRDQKRYSDRLRENQSKTGEQDAVIVAHGRIAGNRVVVAALSFDFMGGSMGVAVGEGLLAAARLAVLQQAPLIAITASGGARMQESILSLMQMPRTVIAVEEVKDAGLPYIVVMTDPTLGGVSASFAMLGDVAIAEPGAIIGFAGPRVIEETIRQTLPNGFQRAEYLLEHGMIDMVVSRHELRGTLGRLVDLLMNRKPAAAIVPVHAEAGERPPVIDLEVTETVPAPEADAAE